MARNYTLQWNADAVHLPATGFADQTTQNGRPVNAFDAAADETIHLAGVLPAEHTGSGTLKLRVFGMASASSGVARFEAYTEFRTPNENESGNADNFDATGDEGTITSNSAYEVASFDITLDPATTPVAGDVFRIKLTRDGDGSGGTDTLAVDFLALHYELFEEV